MKKRMLVIFAMMALMLVLAACTSEEGISETDPDNNTSDAVENEGNAEDVEVDEDLPEETPADEEADNGGEANEEDTAADANSELLNTATVVESDEQDYSLSLLPEYALTSEEPGKDSLYLNEDGSIFMRIETMLAEEGTYDYLHDNMLTILEASSANASTPEELNDEASLPSGEAIQEVKAYSVDSETGPVTGIIFERDGLIVRLTIFDSLEADYFDKFLAMGETVTKTK